MAMSGDIFNCHILATDTEWVELRDTARLWPPGGIVSTVNSALAGKSCTRRLPLSIKSLNIGSTFSPSTSECCSFALGTSMQPLFLIRKAFPSREHTEMRILCVIVKGTS